MTQENKVYGGKMTLSHRQGLEVHEITLNFFSSFLPSLPPVFPLCFLPFFLLFQLWNYTPSYSTLFLPSRRPWGQHWWSAFSPRPTAVWSLVPVTFSELPPYLGSHLLLINSCEKMFCGNRVYIFLWNVILQHFLISETHLQHIYDLGFYPQGLIGVGVSGNLKRKLFPVASIG